jgi:hypothetical protein
LEVEILVFLVFDLPCCMHETRNLRKEFGIVNVSRCNASQGLKQMLQMHSLSIACTVLRTGIIPALKSADIWSRLWPLKKAESQKSNGKDGEAQDMSFEQSLDIGNRTGKPGSSFDPFDNQTTCSYDRAEMHVVFRKA